MSDCRDIAGPTWENKTAPGTLATLRGPGQQRLQGVEVDVSQSTPPDPATEYLDGCPECLVRNNPAHTVERINETSVQAHFTCGACGFEWTCGYWTGVA